MERGQFRNAVWNTVQTNWMPIAKRISEIGDDLKETHVASIKDHFKKSANKGLIDGRKGELEELNKILDSKTPDGRIMKLKGIQHSISHKNR